MKQLFRALISAMPKLRLCRKLKVIRYLCVILVFLPIVTFSPSLTRKLLHLVLDPLAENMTFLLTVNHDYGRLGNKMFKYAALLGIAKREGRTPFVLPYTLDVDMQSIFNLTFVKHHTETNVNRWWCWWARIQETEYAYHDPVFQNLPRRDLMLMGYLQSWKYFRNVEQLVRQEFVFTQQYKYEAEGVLNDIREKRPNKEQIVFVGVHVRRRDDLSTEFTCISPKSYFIKSFQKMRSLLPGQLPIFIVSGNDLTWCEENLASNDTIVLQPSSSAHHFAILSSCSHFIVSIGTFGWWAGWLTGGHVIYYKKFPLPHSHEARGFHVEDYYPPSWIGYELAIRIPAYRIRGLQQAVHFTLIPYDLQRYEALTVQKAMANY